MRLIIKMRLIIALLFLNVFTASLYAQTGGKTKPFVLGVVDEIRSKELGENRILNIYLPEGYNKNDTVTYPVTYLLDGSADEDFIHVAGIYQFESFPWVARVPKTIVVGIANIDRRRDFTFPSTDKKQSQLYPTTGHSDKFIAFIEKELQPYIEKNYKTNGSKTIIGESLGGLLATEVLLKKPELFNKYIIISPSLWWDNGSLLNLSSVILDPGFSQKIEVYIGVGKEGMTPTDIPRVMEVDANLLAEKIQSGKSKNVTVYFDYLPQEDHGSIGHQAVINALKLIYPEKKEEK